MSENKKSQLIAIFDDGSSDSMLTNDILVVANPQHVADNFFVRKNKWPVNIQLYGINQLAGGVLNYAPDQILTIHKDFFPQFAYDHVQSLDGIADTIKSWIDNIDDAELLKALLKEVTGATDVVILDNGNKIAFNTP